MTGELRPSTGKESQRDHFSPTAIGEGEATLEKEEKLLRQERASCLEVDAG